MYYNRARYYDPSNGRFNRTDPYAGNSQDPQSLHKYLYCHNNPINAIDPSGHVALISVALVTLALFTLILAVNIYMVEKAKKRKPPRTVTATFRISLKNQPSDWNTEGIEKELGTTMNQLQLREQDTLNINLIEEGDDKTDPLKPIGWTSTNGLHSHYDGRVIFTNARKGVAYSWNNTTEVHKYVFDEWAAGYTDTISWDLAYSNCLAHEMFWLNMGGVLAWDSQLPSKYGEITSEAVYWANRVSIPSDARRSILNSMDLEY